MKTLPEILEKFSNTIALGIMGNVPGAEGTPIYHEPEGAINAIAKELMGCLPEKRELFEPVTNRPVTDGDKVGVDLDADTRGSLKFIQDNGFNMAIDEVRARLTAFIGRENT